jgi:ABC-2 type transport system permease protein
VNVWVWRPRTLAAPQQRTARWVIASHVLSRTQRIAAIWGIVFGVWVIGTIAAFASSHPTRAQRLEVVESLRSFAILLGPLRHADTVAGFTEWRVLTGVALIGAVWGLMTSTGLLRGEEDAGRWELLLAGPVTKRRATVEALVGMGGAFATQFVLTALLTIAAGRMPAAHFSPGPALLFAVALEAGALMFLAIGALTSQLSATRGQALMIGAAILGGSYAVRIVADSSRALNWLRWATPLGWIEELQPLRNPQLIALAPMLALVLLCVGLTILLAGRRDLGGSVLREREGRSGDIRLLSGPTGLALRLSWPTALAWLAGIASISFVEGSVARTASSFLASSPAMEAALGRLGIRAATLGYLGFAFFFIELLLAVLAASQIAAIRDEEALGRLDNVLVQPVHRVRWLASRLFVSLSIIILGGLTAGFATWVGTATHRTYASLPSLLSAGLNATIPAIFVLGVGVLVLGLRPHFSSAVAYAVVVWSFVIQLIGSFVRRLDWLRDSSIFAHVEPAPARNPDWGTGAIIILLGVVMVVLGALAFQRRDIEYA